QEASSERHILGLRRVLERWQASQRMQCAAYLLLPYQQSSLTKAQISQQFSPTILKFVELIDRLTLLDRTPQPAKQKPLKVIYTDQLRRLLVYAYSDYEIPLFLMATHLAQMEMLDELDRSLQQRWAESSEHIYLRLFDLFGVS